MSISYICRLFFKPLVQKKVSYLLLLKSIDLIEIVIHF